MLYRYHLELAVARDVMPEGFEAADFEAAGLPVPGRGKPAAKLKTTLASKPANPFACDAPDGE
jgi:hypothetical protein